MRIKSDNLQNYSKLNFNSCFIKINETSIQKLVIALPFDSEIYSKKLIYNTLGTIENLNYNCTLYLIYNKKKPKVSKIKNIVYIQKDFNSIYMAFNFILEEINDHDYDYITFLTPGDILKSTTYDFLKYIKEHDIYQINELNKTTFYNEKIPKKEHNHTLNISIYDFNNNMPNNNYVVYDKIYKVSILKINNIKFIYHAKSLYIYQILFIFLLYLIKYFFILPPFVTGAFFVNFLVKLFHMVLNKFFHY
jgi:hypothetical protein